MCDVALLVLDLRNDFRAAIEATANVDVQPLAGRVLYSKLRQPFGFFGGRSECKPRRSPGTLSNSMRACGTECREYIADSRACKAPSALPRRKIIAEQDLQLLYGVTKTDNVLLRKSR